ncbi:MAG: hypothetical protein JWM11_5979 [Planctomycetaceae bacterium]|nr:hypothetical protein [Planctomycetaceae bacterium]
MPTWTRAFGIIIVVLTLGSGDGASLAEEKDAPSLNGRLLFHRYTSYDSYDSQLFLYDFQVKTLTCLSDSWPVDHAMNAHFSPDGKRIAFMALPKGKRDGKDWDVFLWKVGSAENPENLTGGNGLRNEDPNFARDGKSIVFKQAGQIAFLDLGTKKVRRVEIEKKAERSMPVFVSSGRRVVAMENAAADGDLYLYDRDGTNRRAVAAEPKLQEYFPVPWDDDRLLYVRWHTADNRNDQIYVHEWKTGENRALAFCKPDANYSDPYPVDKWWVFFSSNREKGAGGYDLYLGDSKTGAVHNLGVPHLNTKAEELGSSYLPRPKN